MIEVGQDALGGWAWTLVGDDRRILVYRSDYETEAEAVLHAFVYRDRFYQAAALVDGYHGAGL